MLQLVEGKGEGQEGVALYYDLIKLLCSFEFDYVNEISME